MSWAQQWVDIEERRAYLRVRGHPQPDAVITQALLIAQAHGFDPVEAVREAAATAVEALTLVEEFDDPRLGLRLVEPPPRSWWPWRKRSG